MSNIISSFTEILSRRRFILCLTMLTGAVILAPNLDMQLWLANGDHGLNLYGAEAVLRGEKPYRDFTWLYGPAMLYYYGFFMKVLGANIAGVLFGKFILDLLCGLVIYLSLTKFIPPLMAMGGCAWFWLYNKGFFYTYNHAGGTLLISIILYLVFTYILDPNKRIIYLGLAACFLLSLVKLNIGMFNLFGFMVSIILVDKFLADKPLKGDLSFYGGSFAITFGLIAVSYAIFFFDSPLYVLKQSLQLFGNDVSYYYGAGITDHLRQLFVLTLGDITGSWQNLILNAVILISLLTAGYRAFRQKTLDDPARKILAAVAVASVFYILNLHECIGSGIWFRRAWVEPAQLLTAFLIIGFGIQRFQPLVRSLLYSGFILFLAVLVYSELNVIRLFKTTQPKLLLPKSGIYVVNGEQWTGVVTDTVSFLKTNLAPEEQFLALPYDPLYYFLTDRPSPVRELAFWKAMGITETQEKKIIAALQEKNVQWVVLSSRVLSDDPAFGRFGEDHCLILARYIASHYREAASFGDMTVPGGWIDHSIKILKRKRE